MVVRDEPALEVYQHKEEEKLLHKYFFFTPPTVCPLVLQNDNEQMSLKKKTRKVLD